MPRDCERAMPRPPQPTPIVGSLPRIRHLAARMWSAGPPPPSHFLRKSNRLAALGSSFGILARPVTFATAIAPSSVYSSQAARATRTGERMRSHFMRLSTSNFCAARRETARNET